MKNNFFLILKIVLTFSILGYLAVKLEWQTVLQKLSESDPVWVLLGIAIMGVAITLAGVRWWLLLKIQNIDISVRSVIEISYIGQFFNLFLLGSLGGDLVKVYYVTKFASKQKTLGIVSTIVDRCVGMIVLLSFVLVALLAQTEMLMASELLNDIFNIVALLLLCLILFFLFVIFLPLQVLDRVFSYPSKRMPKGHIIELAIRGVKQYREYKGLSFAVIVVSVVIWALVFASGYCVALALNLQIVYAALLTILAVVVLVSSLPISLGGHGMREGAFVVMFALYGVISSDGLQSQQEIAVAFSLLFFSLTLVWGIAGGLVYLIRKLPIPITNIVQ